MVNEPTSQKKRELNLLPEIWQIFGPLDRKHPLSPDLLATVPSKIPFAGIDLPAQTATTRDGIVDMAPFIGGTKEGNSALIYLPLEVEKTGETVFGFAADYLFEAYLDGKRLENLVLEMHPDSPRGGRIACKYANISAGKHLLVVRFISGSCGSKILIFVESGVPVELGNEISPNQPAQTEVRAERTVARVDSLSGSESVFHLPEGVVSRWASEENVYGRKGAATRGNNGRKASPAVTLNSGDTIVIAEAKNTSGIVRRIWLGSDNRLSPESQRALRIDCYWDGATTPAVSAPAGDFFCQSLGKYYPFQNEYFSNPEGRSRICAIPMPFKRGMRITLTNESTDGREFLLFYDVNYTLGDALGENDLYLHAHWRRENLTTIGRDYEFMPQVRGQGRFLGVNFGMSANTRAYDRTWWGEGEVKMYLDGDDKYPTICGTGTEDYIGTSWGQRHFVHRYAGCPYADLDKMQFGFYRLHVPDPIYFATDFRATIQQIGGNFSGYLGEQPEAKRESMAYMIGAGTLLTHNGRPVDMAKSLAESGGPMFDRSDDWSSCSWFYLDRPENDLPLLAPVEERLAPTKML
jgi:hypothetical protein